MRKIISILLSFTLILTISACTGSRMSIIEYATTEYEQSLNQGENQGTSQNQGTGVSQGTTSGSGQQNQTGSSGETSNNQGSTQTPIVEATADNPIVLGTFYRNVAGADIVSDDPDVKEVDKKADEMLKKIEEYPDKIEVTGKTYYVSNDGDDKADGLSPETSKKSYLSFKGQLQAGDAVLFRRGDIFRGQMTLISGITYGAYGEGIKPRFYGSVDGKIGKWEETTSKGVYRYNTPVKYANIIFNNGEAIGRPVQKLADVTNKKYNVYYNGTHITVYSPDGNPKDIFNSIEIVGDYSLFVAVHLKDVKLQNLCLMYTGVSFSAPRGCTYNYEIEGCIMGYCGGKDLYEGAIVSLGNCVEFVSVAVNINIHDNYFFQAYDAALTHQGPFSVDPNYEQLRSTNYTNIHYENNLIEYCTYDVEAFSCGIFEEEQKSPNGTFTYNDVYVRGNICRYTGWGWGSLDRPDKNVYAHFKYDAQGENDTNVHVKPLYIENNIFDRSRRGCLGIKTPEWNKANMILKNNLFLETDRANIIKGKTLKGDYMSEINKYFTAESNTFKIVQ